MDDAGFSVPAGQSASDCTLASLTESWKKFRKQFPDPPIRRVRVTRWLYDRLKDAAAPVPDEADPASFDAMSFRGLPIVVDLPGDHVPGYELDYRVAPKGTAFVEWMNPIENPANLPPFAFRST